MGKVIYNQTIQMSSLASFTMDIKFVIKYYNWTAEERGVGGIYFFMTSKEMVTIGATNKSGLAKDGYELSSRRFGVEFYSHPSKNYIFTHAIGYLPFENVNYTKLDQPLRNNVLWNM